MNKVYISQESFPALLSVLQKGNSQGVKFFIYDPQNLLQNRIWTFSSAVFIPNVKSDDALLKKYQVPVVISKNIEEKSLDSYTRIFYEIPFKNIMEYDNNGNFIAFVSSQNDVKPSATTQVFQKIGAKWEELS